MKGGVIIGGKEVPILDADWGVKMSAINKIAEENKWRLGGWWAGRTWTATANDAAALRERRRKFIKTLIEGVKSGDEEVEDNAMVWYGASTGDGNTLIWGNPQYNFVRKAKELIEDKDATVMAGGLEAVDAVLSAISSERAATEDLRRDKTDYYGRSMLGNVRSGSAIAGD
jgi:hypothetical protein